MSTKTVTMTKWDKARAEVYARDKAICAFRGVSVWLLDLGAVPFAEEEWTDHIRLASKKGSSLPDNLICASVSANYARNKNPAQPPYYFRSGAPTSQFFDDGYDIGPALAALLLADRHIEPSDWYFNRAVAHVLGVVDQWHHKWVRMDGKRMTRTPTYWLKAALQYLQKWRKVSELDRTKPFEARGLVRYPAAPETRLMLRLRKAQTLGEVRDVAKALLPVYARNADSYYAYLQAPSKLQRRALARGIKADRRIHPEIKRMVESSEKHFGRTKGPLYVE